MMMLARKRKQRKAIYLAPGGGRAYPMGRIRTVFKADGAETGGTFSVSEWWLEPNTKGPPAHSHDEDHAWYVIEGTMSVQVDGRWTEAVKGAFLLIPGGVIHTFENRTTSLAAFSVSTMMRDLRSKCLPFRNGSQRTRRRMQSDPG